MSSTDTPRAPSTSGQTAQLLKFLSCGVGALVIPMRRITSMALAGPILPASWANQVFTDFAVAPYMLKVPPSRASALLGPQPGQPGTSPLLKWGGALKVIDGEMPSSRAATTKKVFIADPGRTPSPPPRLPS